MRFPEQPCHIPTKCLVESGNSGGDSREGSERAKLGCCVEIELSAWPPAAGIMFLILTGSGSDAPVVGIKSGKVHACPRGVSSLSSIVAGRFSLKAGVC